jgi:hypothetical protein
MCFGVVAPYSHGHLPYISLPLFGFFCNAAIPPQCCVSEIKGFLLILQTKTKSLFPCGIKEACMKHDLYFRTTEDAKKALATIRQNFTTHVVSHGNVLSFTTSYKIRDAVQKQVANNVGSYRYTFNLEEGTLEQSTETGSTTRRERKSQEVRI